MLEQTREWIVGCRYINLEILALVGDDPLVRQPAVTT
jgi:hypothetical protein